MRSNAFFSDSDMSNLEAILATLHQDHWAALVHYCEASMLNVSPAWDVMEHVDEMDLGYDWAHNSRNQVTQLH